MRSTDQNPLLIFSGHTKRLSNSLFFFLLLSLFALLSLSFALLTILIIILILILVLVPVSQYIVINQIKVIKIPHIKYIFVIAVRESFDPQH